MTTTSPELSQMKLLISLAHIDGEVADRERNYIINIGRANGIYPDLIEPLLQEQHEMIVPTNLTPDKKFDIIFSLVQLVKIDERMYKEELQYCAAVATKLGYTKQVLFDLLLHVKTSAMPEADMQVLKTSIQKHLKA